MPLVLKVCQGTFNNASRDHRELAAAQEAGFDVQVLAAPLAREDDGKVETVKGFEVHRYRPELNVPWRQGKNIFSRLCNSCMGVCQTFLYRFRPARYLVWAHKIRTFRANLLSGHDIYALTACWAATLFTPKAKKPLLVYDSHEFMLGTTLMRSRLERFVYKHLERFLMKRCAFSIMVNDSIADAVQALHHLDKRPLVIRNTANNWPLDEAVIAQKRRDMLDATGGGEDAFLVMNHGGLMPLRGQESLVHTVAANPRVRGVLMGFAMKPGYVESLKTLAETLGVSGRVAFLPGVPQDEIWQYAGAADLALILIHGQIQNHFWSLPNKFFENIQSLTPVLCSDYPEMRRLVTEYDIGLTVDPDDQAAIDAAVERLRTDGELRARFKQNLLRAKQELCWEREKTKLVDAYRALLPKV